MIPRALHRKWRAFELITFVQRSRSVSKTQDSSMQLGLRIESAHVVVCHESIGATEGKGDGKHTDSLSYLYLPK